MIGLVRIAPIHLRQRRLRERRLDAHHRGRVRLRHLRRVAEQLEHPRDVRNVLLARLHRLGIGLDVVVAIRQPQPARVDVDDDLAGVLRVLRGVNAEEQPRAGNVLMQVTEQRAELLAVSQPLDAREIVPQRQHARARSMALVSMHAAK